MEFTVRQIEPIFGKFAYLYCISANCMEHLMDVKEKLSGRFGLDGGEVMKLVVGDIGVSQYTMKCEIRGEFDYNIGYLEMVETLYGMVLDCCGVQRYYRIDDMLRKVRSRLRSTVRILRLRMMDRL